MTKFKALIDEDGVLATHGGRKSQGYGSTAPQKNAARSNATRRSTFSAIDQVGKSSQNDAAMLGTFEHNQQRSL